MRVFYLQNSIRLCILILKGESMDKDLIDEKFFDYEAELDKAHAHQTNEYLVIRAGRANPHILDKISIDYYGVPTPIKQLANISVQEARILCINVWDASQIKNVSKAIAASDIGITPTDDGKIIRLVFPQLNEERRKEIVKQIKKIAEDTKIAMRSARRDIMDFLKDQKKNSQISEDEYTSLEGDVQKLLDKYIEKVDALFAAKEKEILEI